jgi:hypothetical protein
MMDNHAEELSACSNLSAARARGIKLPEGYAYKPLVWVKDMPGSAVIRKVKELLFFLYCVGGTIGAKCGGCFGRNFGSAGPKKRLAHYPYDVGGGILFDRENAQLVMTGILCVEAGKAVEEIGMSCIREWGGFCVNEDLVAKLSSNVYDSNNPGAVYVIGVLPPTYSDYMMVFDPFRQAHNMTRNGGAMVGSGNAAGEAQAAVAGLLADAGVRMGLVLEGAALAVLAGVNGRHAAAVMWRELGLLEPVAVAAAITHAQAVWAAPLIVLE